MTCVWCRTLGIQIGLVGLACLSVTGQVPRDPALRAYVEQIDREWPGEAAQQALTAESLRLLANAIESVAGCRGLASANSRVNDLRAQTRDYAAVAPDRLDQTRRLRQIFISTAVTIEHLVKAGGQEKEPVDPRISALRRSAESLDPAMSLHRQPDVIERFFHHSAEALQRLDCR